MLGVGGWRPQAGCGNWNKYLNLGFLDLYISEFSTTG